VLLLSRERAYAVRSSITVAPLTQTVRGIPVEVPLGPADGVARECAVNCDGIVTIRKNLLDRRITSLSANKMAAVERAIRFALDLD